MSIPGIIYRFFIILSFILMFVGAPYLLFNSVGESPEMILIGIILTASGFLILCACALIAYINKHRRKLEK